MKRFAFVTLFKEPLKVFLQSSLMGRAQTNGQIDIKFISLLDHVNNDHHKLDDKPYGGGCGELLRVDILVKALEDFIKDSALNNPRILLMDPAGKRFDQKAAKRLSGYEEIIFICGRYEGIDARIYHFVDEALSLGDFVLSNGDIAAVAMADSIARFLPNFLHNEGSLLEESHEQGRLEASQYTRPENFRGLKVPDVFKSGHHQNISIEKKIESIKKTDLIRPDLIKKFPLSFMEKNILSKKSSTQKSYPWQKLYE